MAQIWPIGGGKGGTGKSFLAGSLGICLARKGKRTLLVDADFGAANLHTIIGVPHPEKSLSDFINKNVRNLEETIVETPSPELYLISGARNNLDIANLAYEQKMKIMRAISKLPFEYILLDLGAGTSFNTIDFFLISDQGIFITTPEPTSIENIYRLIRSVYLRKIRQVIKAHDFKTLIQEALKRDKNTAIDYLHQLLSILKELDQGKGIILEQSLQDLRFKLVVNQFRKHDNPSLGVLMCRILEKHLGINIQFLGNISFDDRVHDAVCKKTPFVSKYPYTQTAIDLQEFCNHMLTIREELPPLTGSSYGITVSSAALD
ncbi:MAG: AAA family ATPase [Syntrophales bacterium]